jgi:phytoene dehydrogenase-like protein
VSLRALVVGAGHNGLVCAAYLARAGLQVTVLERRERVGGACVSEELWPGYRVSRAAYVLSLFRPVIVQDLELERHGLKLLARTPASLTPLPDGRCLVLGADQRSDFTEIAQFSRRDAEQYVRYERWLEEIARAVEPLLDDAPPHLLGWDPVNRGRWRAVARAGRELWRARSVLFGPARAVLEDWFESEPLRATLATDAIIGAFASPASAGTGYVLFHHCMGELGGRRGVWAYVAGGMGRLSESIASAARAAGALIRTDCEVVAVRARGGRACGVALSSGETLDADVVISGADLTHTAAWLEDAALRRHFPRADTRSPVVKLNLALRGLPEFRLRRRDELPLSGTIHIGPTDLDGIERAFEDAQAGRVSRVPVVELTIPSVVDPSLAPPGRHVASIFAQYAPVLPADASSWSEHRDAMRDNAFAAIETVAPGFRSLVEHCEVLAAPDLERVFALAGGNIFHGAMRPSRLLLRRPSARLRPYRTPLAGLWLCGSATHPGGGVMGAPGRNAALEILAALAR